MAINRKELEEMAPPPDNPDPKLEVLSPSELKQVLRDRIDAGAPRIIDTGESSEIGSMCLIFEISHRKNEVIKDTVGRAVGRIDRADLYNDAWELLTNEYGMDWSRSELENEIILDDGTREESRKVPSTREGLSFHSKMVYTPGANIHRFVVHAVHTRDFQLDRPRPRNAVDAMFEDFFGKR